MKNILRNIGHGFNTLLFRVGILKTTASSIAEIALSEEPDLPVPFGYKSVWFAVKSDDTLAVFDAFNLTSQLTANWETGVSFAYDYTRQFKGKESPVFVAPPLEGWTLVLAGLNIAADSSENIEKLRNLLNRLSEKFGEVQYFGSYRGADYVSWFKSLNGNIVRGFSYADGTLFANEGQTTQAELDIGYFDMTAMDETMFWDALQEDEEDGTYHFDEEDPMKIAEFWSVNPLSIDVGTGIVPATGLVGLYLD